MASLRVRLRFNPGRDGSPMDKLGDYASQSEKFLRALAADFGVSPTAGKWLARNFTNESVAFDGQFSESVPEDVAIRARVALERLGSEQPIDAYHEGLVGYSTLEEFAKIGKSLDADEVFCLGIYDSPDGGPIEWRSVSHRTTSELRQLLEAPISSVGSAQGIVHAWHPGATPPFFQLRELSTSALLRCNYGESLYKKVHAATKRPNTVCHVYGIMAWGRAEGKAEQITVDDIEIAEPLSDLEFHQIFGMAPKFTGDLTTDQYVDWMRDGEE
jgi:hypothetical protein